MSSLNSEEHPWTVTEKTHSFIDPVIMEKHTLTQTDRTLPCTLSSSLVQQRPDQILSISAFAEVYLLGNNIVRKLPCSESEEDMEPILREATIYTMLHDHPRIAQCLSRGQLHRVDLKYYPNGDLASYLQKNKGSIESGLRSKWFEQIIEAVDTIHKHGVIHSDLALRQFLLDDDLNVRLGDFNASQYPGYSALGYEKAPYCLPRDYGAPNTITSDLFALGSTLYELMVGKAPYDELYPIEPDAVLRDNNQSTVWARIGRREKADERIETLYSKQVFPDVSGIFGGEIILGCWKEEFSSAKEVLRRHQVLLWRHSPFQRLKYIFTSFIDMVRERVKLSWRLSYKKGYFAI